MIRLFANANYDFIKWRRWAYGLTAAIIIPGFALFLVHGLNYSIEFTGGTLIQVQTKEAVGTERIRSALDAAGIRDAEIQQFGGPTEYKIQARIAKEGVAEGSTEATAAAVDSALARGLGSGPEHYTIVRTEAVGPKVGRELQGKAFLAIFFSFIVTLFYLAFRFEWRFGLAAVLATFHDILTTIAFIRYLDLEVSLVVVGAVLTMVGYSLNDTIIIFDRVRENLHKFRRQNLYEILNLSINETLPRSVLTHGTTMATTIALVLLAGEVHERDGGRHGGSVRQHRARQRFVDREVQDLVQVLAPELVQVLANAVEDDDRVVERVADHGQDRAHDHETHLEVEIADERDRGEDVVERREHGGEPEAPLEAEREVDQGDDEREKDRQERLALELAAHLRPDRLGADDGVVLGPGSQA